MIVNFLYNVLLISFMYVIVKMVVKYLKDFILYFKVGDKYVKVNYI